MLCVLGFQELANVMGLSHPGEKRRTNLQDQQVLSSKQREQHHGGWSGKQRFWIALMSFYLSVAGVRIWFIDSQIAVLSFYFVSCKVYFVG